MQGIEGLEEQRKRGGALLGSKGITHFVLHPSV